MIEGYSRAKSDEKEFINKFMSCKKNANIDYLLTDMKDALSESLEGVEKIKSIVLDLKDFSRSDKSEFNSADVNDGIEKSLNIIWNELKYKAEVIKEFGDVPKI